VSRAAGRDSAGALGPAPSSPAGCGACVTGDGGADGGADWLARRIFNLVIFSTPGHATRQVNSLKCLAKLGFRCVDVKRRMGRVRPRNGMPLTGRALGGGAHEPACSFAWHRPRRTVLARERLQTPAKGLWRSHRRCRAAAAERIPQGRALQAIAFAGVAAAVAQSHECACRCGLAQAVARSALPGLVRYACLDW
jgi:hypothetical protein